jgi:hypothetical protein
MSNPATPRDPVLYHVTDKRTGEVHRVYAKNTTGAIAVVATHFEARRPTVEEALALERRGIVPINSPSGEIPDDAQAGLPL